MLILLRLPFYITGPLKDKNTINYYWKEACIYDFFVIWYATFYSDTVVSLIFEGIKFRGFTTSDCFVVF